MPTAAGKPMPGWPMPSPNTTPKRPSSPGARAYAAFDTPGEFVSSPGPGYYEADGRHEMTRHVKESTSLRYDKGDGSFGTRDARECWANQPRGLSRPLKPPALAHPASDERARDFANAAYQQARIKYQHEESIMEAPWPYPADQQVVMR